MVKENYNIKPQLGQEVEILKEIKLSYAIVRLRADGIVHVHTLKELCVELEEAIGLVGTNQKITNNTPHLCLLTSPKFVLPSNQAMEYLSGKTNRDYFNLADACVINSLPQRILGNFYHNIVKPKTPTKFFKGEEAAIAWLKKQKRQ